MIHAAGKVGGIQANLSNPVQFLEQNVTKHEAEIQQVAEIVIAQEEKMKQNPLSLMKLILLNMNLVCGMRLSSVVNHRCIPYIKVSTHR